MAKKIIVLLVFLLAVFGSHAIAYASDPLDDLDDRAGTENLAGMTWDEISEMSNNSPNSLSPVQALVLWMFAILAFLKLAQKMDSLLQSLGLNVTQTGGRALGDLVMAGMAIKNIGGMMSRGIGMFSGGGGSGGGAGGSGGCSGGGSGSGGGTGSSGGSSGGGPAPIPTGSPGSGGSPGGASPSGGASPGGGTGGGTLGGATPTGGTPTGGTSPSGTATGTPSGGTPSSSGTSGSGTPTGNNSPNATATEAADSATSNKNAVGRAVDWMREDGFAQGAIKAGAKGGAIGLGIYGIKKGASKIGEAASNYIGDNGISADPNSSLTAENNGLPQGGQPQSDANVNPEEYQDSRPLDGTDEHAPIPTSINGEEYQEASAYDSYDTSADSIPSSYNDEDYNDAASYNAAGTNPIPTGDVDKQDYSDSGDYDSSNYDSNGETWQDSSPGDTASGALPIPTSVNGEGWNETGASGSQTDMATTSTETAAVVSDKTTSAETADGNPTAGVQSANVATAAVVATAASGESASLPPTANAPIGTSPQGKSQPPDTNTTTGNTVESASAQSESVSDQAEIASPTPQTKSAFVIGFERGTAQQDTAATSPPVKSAFVEGFDRAVARQNAAATPAVSSSASSDSVTVASASATIVGKSSTHGEGADYSGTNNISNVGGNSGEVYESRQTPLNNQSIPADLPQNASVVDSAGGSPIASSDTSLSKPAPISQIPVHSDGSAISSDSPVAQPATIQHAPSQLPQEPIRVDSPPSAQFQAMAASEQVSVSQINTAVTSVTETGGTMSGQAAVSPSAQIVQVDTQGTNAPANSKHAGNNKPATNAQPKNPVTMARKKKR